MSVTPNTDNTEAAVAERRVRWTVDWIKLAPWLYTIGLFAIWEHPSGSSASADHPARAIAIAGARYQYWPAIQRHSLQRCSTTTSVFRMGGRSAGLALALFDRLIAGHLCRPLPDHGRLQRHSEGKPWCRSW